MGVIKRMLRRTSRKLLAKIAPPPHELVLNPPLEPENIASPTDSKHARRLAKKYRKSIKNTAVAEALLLAVKNHLPAVQFHHVHGPNIQLTKNKCVARRTQSFCQALVFSNRVILPNERVYIKVLEIAKGWSGTIRFGFTAVDPATLACRMPKHACPDMTNAGHTWARALADEVVRRNSVIHFSYNKDGLIHYGINNQDCGVFHANIGTNQNLWFIVDIYGLTAAVELIDPRVNSASSETDISQLDDSHRGAMSRSTMFKSTTAMEELFGLYGGPSEGRLRSKQSRKLAARRAAMIQNNWAFEHSIGSPFLSFNSSRRHYPGTQLPNLNAINLPSAQQNIYSPLPDSSSESPTRGNVNPNETHDYYQIYSKSNAANVTYQQHNATHPRLTNDANSFCPNNSPPVASTSMPTVTSLDPSQTELELSQRLENTHIHDRHSRRPQHSTPKSQSRPSASAQVPVAAIRRRIPQQQQQQQQTCVDQTAVLKQMPDAPDKATVANRLRSGKSQASASKSTANAASNGNERSRARHSIKNQRSATSLDRDKNNNSPPSKDCPICFERPINCVLYQCGHMCTCYECGVKQWKTQSRTCPICRTVIKDVIKTYMS